MKGKIKETDMVEAHSTYGVSKLAADGLVQVRGGKPVYGHSYAAVQLRRRT